MMHEMMSFMVARVVDAALAAAVVSGVAAAAMILTRQPSRRRALARAGMIGALVVVPLVVLRPFAPLDVLGPVRLALEPWGGGPGIEGVRWLDIAARALPIALLSAYVAGVAFGLARLALGSLGAGWIGRNSRPTSDDARAIYDGLASAPGLRRPALRVSDRTTRPVLLGAFRPTLLIPPDLDRPEASDALRLALLHELAHAEASDPWFGLVMEVASTLWFWVPPVLWISRQARLDQEFLADRRAADRLGPSSARYASGLVEIAAARDGGGGAVSPAPSGGSALLQRVLMLVRCPFVVEARPPRWWGPLVVVATGAVVLLAAGVSIRAQTHHAPPPEPRSVAIGRLVLEARSADGPATSLPVRLPPDFDLEFEVVAPAADLARIEVLGHPLAGEEPQADRVAGAEAGAHRIAIRRRGGGLSLAIDGGPMRRLTGISAEPWLTARGLPGVPVVLRSLRLVW